MPYSSVVRRGSVGLARSPSSSSIPRSPAPPSSNPASSAPPPPPSALTPASAGDPAPAADGEVSGTFAIAPASHVRDIDEAYGPLSISDSERGKTVAELITQRVGGRPDYADRVRLGTIVLIVRDIDEHGHIASVGVSMEPVEPATPWPIFLNIRELAHAVRDYIRQKRALARAAHQTEK